MGETTLIVTVRGDTKSLPVSQKGVACRDGKYLELRADELRIGDLVLYAPHRKGEGHLDLMKRRIVELRPVLKIEEPSDGK